MLVSAVQLCAVIYQVLLAVILETPLAFISMRLTAGDLQNLSSVAASLHQPGF